MHLQESKQSKPMFKLLQFVCFWPVHARKKVHMYALFYFCGYKVISFTHYAFGEAFVFKGIINYIYCKTVVV